MAGLVGRRPSAAPGQCARIDAGSDMPTEKILVVDDERLVRWSLRQKCEEWGYHVIEAEAGETWLEARAA